MAILAALGTAAAALKPGMGALATSGAVKGGAAAWGLSKLQGAASNAANSVNKMASSYHDFGILYARQIRARRFGAYSTAGLRPSRLGAVDSASGAAKGHRVESGELYAKEVRRRVRDMQIESNPAWKNVEEIVPSLKQIIKNTYTGAKGAAVGSAGWLSDTIAGALTRGISGADLKRERKRKMERAEKGMFEEAPDQKAARQTLERLFPHLTQGFQRTTEQEGMGARPGMRARGVMSDPRFSFDVAAQVERKRFELAQNPWKGYKRPLIPGDRPRKSGINPPPGFPNMFSSKPLPSNAAIPAPAGFGQPTDNTANLAAMQRLTDAIALNTAAVQLANGED